MVMCNMGSSGWRLGRVIALHYREDGWPPQRVAPYQVALEGDHSLIYVPRDMPDYCREASGADINIARRLDALAAPPPGSADRDVGEMVEAGAAESGSLRNSTCAAREERRGVLSYRDGMCHCCGRCPREWSAVELYSEHYRAAARNGLRITRRAADLGVVQVGAPVNHPAPTGSAGGFAQCPTLPRLPPGLTFSDDGSLSGTVHFDPHRPASYKVEFVAVSTAEWNIAEVGIVRLEITFVVEANVAPPSFDRQAFELEQGRAGAEASRLLNDIGGAWELYEREELSHDDTVKQMTARLHELRSLLEQHPRLDRGKFWAELGGFHMNVHKLLENTLFECELYLGHALMFPDADVRSRAEENLEGCYQKRLLEAARFMWMDGCLQMMRGEWSLAAETLRLAADKKDGWGWGVNHGDIWLAEATARIVLGAESEGSGADAAREFAEVARLLDAAALRCAEHPWLWENRTALAEYRALPSAGPHAASWLCVFKERAVFWSAQVLGGGTVFPPRTEPRSEDAGELQKRLPGHNAVEYD